MIGPLREALIEAARAGKLTPPPDLSAQEWQARLQALYPGATPEAIEAARRAAQAMWADESDPDFGV